MQAVGWKALALGAVLVGPVAGTAVAQDEARGGVSQAAERVASARWLQAAEDAAHEDRLEPLALELEGLGEPRFELAFGASATRRGFALEIAGGVPAGWALLSFESEEAPLARELVRLDSDGGARIVRRDWRAPRDVRATCRMLRPSGRRASLALTIPAAASFPAPQPRALSAASVVITEIMKDPTAVADSAGEWFEVRNLTSQPVDLAGWVITDGGSNTHAIGAASGAVWIPARSYYVFGINANTLQNGGIPVDYRYSSFTLANGADSIQLYDSTGMLVDAVSYDDGIFWPDTPGKSLSLDRALIDAVANDDGANWCDAILPLSAGNQDCATPRRANTVCP